MHFDGNGHGKLDCGGCAYFIADGKKGRCVRDGSVRSPGGGSCRGFTHRDAVTPLEEVLASERVNLTWLMHNYDEYVQVLAERGECFRLTEVGGRTVVAIEPIAKVKEKVEEEC